VSKFSVVTMDKVLETLSSLEPEKYILFALPTSPSRSLDYLARKLGFKKQAEVADALFFQAKFSCLEEAREFVIEYLADDGFWQELALGIYLNGKLIWEGAKK